MLLTVTVDMVHSAEGFTNCKSYSYYRWMEWPLSAKQKR